MKTSSESRKSNKAYIFNEQSSTEDALEEQNIPNDYNKHLSTVIDDKILDQLNIEDLKSLLKIEMTKTTELENELKAKNEKIFKLEIELAEHIKSKNEKNFNYDMSLLMNSPCHSVIRDHTINRKQSSVSILNNSQVNRSIDSNALSLNSYNNKLNTFSNSFSTLSNNFPTKGLNRSEIVSYTRRRPELEIEELYDNEMESYLSHAKKEDTTLNDIDLDIGKLVEMNNDTDLVKSNKLNIKEKQISSLNKFSTSVIIPSKSSKAKPVSHSSKTLPDAKVKVIAKKPIARSGSVVNIKKVAPIPTGKKTAANPIPAKKKENLASVDKSKGVVSTESSAKSKNSSYSTTVNSAKKPSNSKAPSISVNPEKLDVKNNTKRTSRTNSIFKSIIPDKNFKTKAEAPVNKFASIDKKVIRK